MYTQHVQKEMFCTRAEDSRFTRVDKYALLIPFAVRRYVTDNSSCCRPKGKSCKKNKHKLTRTDRCDSNRLTERLLRTTCRLPGEWTR